ncbi:hypothetical protein [Bifidobacterium sp. SO1]|uniref:hypothetical protein n=1 Tax=Bifidobacterium sp. SO1 TaxID=2809029 RepID=UPI001BDC0717|nr:hypothetical protein [Bifidobacterium sp. SO1]MBT1162581.1 hypothetical protein [Bifidobacterium sp. SO1]
MDKSERHAFLESCSDFALYEMFYEMGTMYGGTLVALEDKAERDGDAVAFQNWRREHLAMYDARDDTSSKDRPRQIRLLEQWTDRREELERLLKDDSEKTE